MRTLIATYRMVTPMFCGGADQEAELRLPSFKGALRFWWRALMWSKVQDVEALRQTESKLFGCSGEHGQSRVIMSMQDPRAKHSLDSAGWKANRWENYTGYGLHDAKRQALGGSIKFKIIFIGKSDGVFDDDFLDALRLLGLVGGLGARGRNGWGSLSLLKLEGAATWNAPCTSTELRQELKRIVNTAKDVSDVPPFTALSARCELGIGREFQNADAAQRALGQFYKSRVQELPKDKTRWQFGIPRQSKRAALRNPDRRAKPLFLHVHQAANAKAIPVALFVPAQFTESAPSLPNDGAEARALVGAIENL
jgi:CRISPR-associated protein Cmr1